MKNEPGANSVHGRSTGTWKGGLCLLIAATGLCLAGAELYVRKTTPYVIGTSTVPLSGKEVLSGSYGYFLDTFSGRRLIPDTRVLRVGPDGSRVPIDINSRGLRDDEIPPVKDHDETRVLVLGDSITFGAEVPIAETYPKRAEAYLNGPSRTGWIRCINGGIEGIGTKDEVDLLVDLGLGLSPDVVVIGFYLNDSNPPDRFGMVLANPGFLRRHSVLAQTVYRAYKAFQLSRGELRELDDIYAWTYVDPPADWRTNRASLLRYASVADKDWGAAWKPESWTGIDEQLQRLKKLSDRHDFRVVFCMFPSAYQVYAEYIEDEPQRRLGALTRRYGFAFLDLLPTFRSTERPQKLFVDDCHLTKAGNDVAGRTLAAFLAEMMPADGRGRTRRE
jgi:lysophospholipase L1-like esterase